MNSIVVGLKQTIQVLSQQQVAVALSLNFCIICVLTKQNIYQKIILLFFVKKYLNHYLEVLRIQFKTNGMPCLYQLLSNEEKFLGIYLVGLKCLLLKFIIDMNTQRVITLTSILRQTVSFQRREFYSTQVFLIRLTVIREEIVFYLDSFFTAIHAFLWQLFMMGENSIA